MSKLSMQKIERADIGNSPNRYVLVVRKTRQNNLIHSLTLLDTRAANTYFNAIFQNRKLDEKQIELYMFNFHEIDVNQMCDIILRTLCPPPSAYRDLNIVNFIGRGRLHYHHARDYAIYKG